MATKARGGFGSKLYREDTPGGGTFSVIAEAMDFSGPDKTHQTQDVTNMDSANGWVEKIALGIKEGADLTFDCNLIDNDVSQVNLESDLESGTVRNFRLVYPSGTKRLEFAAIVSKLGQSLPVKGAIKRSITLTPAGQVSKVAHP